MKETAHDPLSQERLIVVAATIGINIVAVALLIFAPWSDWKTGLALNLVDNALFLGYVATHRDSVLARFMVFGLAVGFAELAADAWLVDYTKTLDYSVGGGPMLWRSPLWMPFAWEVVAVQFGYIGLWLWKRYGRLGLVTIGLLGAINIPYYEEMARRINWWQYRNCHMLSLHALLHHPRRIRHRDYSCATGKTRGQRRLEGRRPGRYRRRRRDLRLLCPRLRHHRWAYYPLKRGKVIMSRSQVGTVLFGRTYAAEATRSSFFNQNMRCLFTGNGFNGCEPESVEIQAGKEMLPFPQENRRHG